CALPILIADIGAQHARFSGGSLTPRISGVPCAKLNLAGGPFQGSRKARKLSVWSEVICGRATRGDSDRIRGDAGLRSRRLHGDGRPCPGTGAALGSGAPLRPWHGPPRGAKRVVV